MPDSDRPLANQQRKPTTFVELAFCAGDPKSACIMTVGANAVAEFHRLAGTPEPKTKPQDEQLGERMGHKTTEMSLNQTYFNRVRLADWFSGSRLTEPWLRLGSRFPAYVSSLMACASAAEIYKLLPGATISTIIL